MESSRASLSADIATTANQKSPLTVPAFINGQPTQLSSTFPVISPYTGQTAWYSASASPSDAVDTVVAASAAFPSWATTKPSKRRDILLKAAQLLEERADQWSAVMRTEMGADYGASQKFVLPVGISMLRDCAARTSAIQGAVPTVDTDGQTAMVLKEPIGVVLGIVPW